MRTQKCAFFICIWVKRTDTPQSEIIIDNNLQCLIDMKKLSQGSEVIWKNKFQRKMSSYWIIYAPEWQVFFVFFYIKQTLFIILFIVYLCCLYCVLESTTKLFQLERTNKKQWKKMALVSPLDSRVGITSWHNVNSSWRYSNVFHLVGFM